MNTNTPRELMDELFGPLMCDVCCKNTALGVACSPLGPVSFAYCSECLDAGADVYYMLVTTAAAVGGAEHLAEWALRYVAPTLERTGRTPEQFAADVAEAVREAAG